MATNAQLAARLLRNAADFFRTIGADNPQLNEDMETNAQTYELVADWVESDPSGQNPLSDAKDEDD
ncbi:MAG: hypothetical protein MI806_03960 [Minwuiales bacterium]|nr:hypothetical protein [Minwuiales bacterium]